MNETKRHRIKFYSKEDRSGGHQLSEAEKLLDDFEYKSDLSLNDLIEYYNIKIYFDNKLFLPSWTEPQQNKYINTVEQAFKMLKERVLAITDGALEQELKDLYYNYFEDFWKLIDNLSVYKNITDQTFTSVLQNNQRQVCHILEQKRIVEKYDRVIRDFLMTFSSSAEIILSSLEEKSTFNTKRSKYFPKSLNLNDKESIINTYLDGEEPNLNYVRLIEHSRDTNEFKLSAKTRLKAKKKSTELNKKMLQNENVSTTGIKVSFDKDQIEHVIYNSESTDLEISYSESFIDRFTDNVNLFRIFKYPFIYVDDKNLITLVSNQSELDVFERILMKSRNEYETGLVFHRKEYISLAQLLIYEHYLQRRKNSVETLINSYVDFINEKIKPHKLIFKITSTEASYLEKIRVIAPDFEFLLKQFKTFVDEKCIDLDLIQIDSIPIRFSEIYSLKSKKYLYSTDDLILQLKHIFFSDQSHLSYTKRFESKYQCFYDLIINENVKLEDFEDFQKPTIEHLINIGYLKINSEYVALNQDIVIYLIGEMHKNEVISYWNYPKEIRIVIDELIDKKLLTIENTLYTRQERDYLNYYLNKKEFTNGFDLRNKYLHGTNTFSENEHERDYYRLIKIIILTLLKIEDDITP